jgi:hypothetical protein
MHALYYGRSKTPLAWVKPDERYPSMWRIHWPDGEVSDMVNLTRARDAAVAGAERGPPRLERRIFHWQQDSRQTPSGAP